jgi:NAD(P)H-flavin reductase
MVNSRWDQDFVRRQVYIKKKESKLNKIYVCGPPVMAELFDRTLDQMIATKDLSRSQVEVM